MPEQQTSIYPIEMDRTIVGTHYEITDQDNREIDLKAWISRGDYEGLVIELPDGADWLCLNLVGLVKIKQLIEDAIMIVGRWED